MKIIKLEDHESQEVFLRSKLDAESVMDTVKDILTTVKENGDTALRQYTEKFDKADLNEIKVDDEVINNSLLNLDDNLINALKKAADNIAKFHKAQIPDEWMIEVEDGVTAGQVIRPLDCVGCYIPGGRAVYPSTILMTVIPAKIAGVSRIICCTPPQPDGSINSVVLAAAKVAGATEIYKVGGAQAVAAMAYGTETIPSVDKIVGPGNIFVTAAKKMVYGDVDIDFPAGPSEVLIIADDTGNPEYIAMDMMAQAEHDPNAACVFVTTSEAIAIKVDQLIKEQLNDMERSEIIYESLEKYGLIAIAGSIEAAIEFSNKYAPEHLIIMTKKPEEVLKSINNAGSIFLGDLTPVAAGDYGSGTNHVLPTSGCARMYSGLSAESFLKKPTVQKLTHKGIINLNNMVTTLAEYEGLYAHSASFKKRFNDVKKEIK
ncbi:MAG TPA: histidinol dehydrogenase [Methanobacterium sp.]